MLDLIDGSRVELSENFSGIVTRINGMQYIITRGFPDDEEEEKEKVVWVCNNLGEVENIGTYYCGEIV